MSEIYQPPSAELTQQDNLSQLERAVEGDYQFTILEAFREGRELANGHKWPIQKAGLMMFLVVLPAYLLFLIAPSFLFSEEGAASILASTAGNLLYIWITTPISAGLLLMAANRATGNDIDTSYLWAYFSQASKLLGVMLLMYVFITLGFLLLIIPGIYLSIAYLFATALAADKGLGVWDALETSRKAISKRWFAFFGLCLLLAFVNMIAMIPLGLGLIWTFPWSLCTMGVVYRNMFGFEAKTRA